MQKLVFLQKCISTYYNCSDSGWNVVNFLHKFGLTNKPGLITQLGCGWTVLDDKPFSHSTQSAPSAVRLYVGKIMGGERAQTANLNWPKAGSIWYDVLHNHNNRLPRQLFRVWLGIDLPSEMVSNCCVCLFGFFSSQSFIYLTFLIFSHECYCFCSCYFLPQPWRRWGWKWGINHSKNVSLKDLSEENNA